LMQEDSADINYSL